MRKGRVAEEFDAFVLVTRQDAVVGRQLPRKRFRLLQFH